MGIKFSEQSIKASFLVQNPDWYRYKCTKLIKKPTADGKSKNFIFVFEGLSGEMAGVPVSILINEKADWVLVPLFKAANGGEIAVGVEYNEDDLVDCLFEGYTKRGNRQDGTPANIITEWAPVGTNTQDE